MPVGALALLALAGVRYLLRLQDPDTFWHLRAGEYLWQSWQFSGPEPWTRFATRPWVLHEWAPELVMAGTFRLGGYPAVATLQALASIAILFVLYGASRRHARPLPASAAACLAWVGTWGDLSARPQLVTLVLLALATSAWLATARDGRPRWWLVPMTWVWACSHGLWVAGVVTGVVAIAGIAADRRLDLRDTGRLALVPVLSVVAAALTPVGPRLLTTPFEVVGYAQFVAEWHRTSPSQPYTAATIAMLAIIAASWIRRRRNVAWIELGLWCLALIWTLLYSRTVALAAVTLAPVLAGSLQALLPAGSQALHRRTEIRAVVAGCAIVVLVAAALAPFEGAPERVPTGLDSAVADLPARTVLYNQYELGGWLLWAHRNVDPVIDGRTEVYSVPYVKAYFASLTATGAWQSVVRDSRARAALLPSGSPLTIALVSQWRWTRVASDRGYVLLTAP